MGTSAINHSDATSASHSDATSASRSDATTASRHLDAGRSTRMVDVACRVLDVTFSLILLLVFMPLMIGVAAAIRLDSRGAVLFRQRRLGRSLTPFTVHKFRTMMDGASHDIHRAFVLSLIAGEQPAGNDGQPRFKLSADQRVTRVGRLLRRSSLDELPQLWDVLRGRMSLVGPRPAIPYEVDHYPRHWFNRFAVKPGITGLWQVSGRSELTMEDMVKLDIEYAERRSLRLNIWILLRTVPAVLSRRGAS
jgi:lipopolysaccharide/colanic/teichoic acid biosynthesis glycosyltransferase